MSHEWNLENWARFVREEFDVDQIELVGEPIRLNNDESLYVFDSTEEDAVFIVRSLVGARHQKPNIASFGNGNYNQGLIKAIGLYSTLDVAATKDNFDTIFDTVDGTQSET